MYSVCKRVYTSPEALTVVVLGIQVFQDVTQCCLDLLLDKYLHCRERAAQIMHNLKVSMLFSFISVSQQQLDHTQNSLLCWYLSVHDMWVHITMA